MNTEPFAPYATPRDEHGAISPVERGTGTPRPAGAAGAAAGVGAGLGTLRRVLVKLPHVPPPVTGTPVPSPAWVPIPGSTTIPGSATSPPRLPLLLHTPFSMICHFSPRRTVPWIWNPPPTPLRLPLLGSRMNNALYRHLARYLYRPSEGSHRHPWVPAGSLCRGQEPGGKGPLERGRGDGAGAGGGGTHRGSRGTLCGAPLARSSRLPAAVPLALAHRGAERITGSAPWEGTFRSGSRPERLHGASRSP